MNCQSQSRNFFNENNARNIKLLNDISKLKKDINYKQECQEKKKGKQRKYTPS